MGRICSFFHRPSSHCVNLVKCLCMSFSSQYGQMIFELKKNLRDFLIFIDMEIDMGMEMLNPTPSTGLKFLQSNYCYSHFVVILCTFHINLTNVSSWSETNDNLILAAPCGMYIDVLTLNLLRSFGVFRCTFSIKEAYSKRIKIWMLACK